MSAYASDGVDVPLGNKFSQYAYLRSKETWRHPFVQVLDCSNGRFRGPRLHRINLPNGFYEMTAADGIGTKVGIITEAMSHEHAAKCLVAMACGDITRYGGKPVIFSNVLDVATLGPSEHSDSYASFVRAIDGLTNVAREQGLVLLGGETAELGAFVGSENPNALTKFNWAGFAIGVAYKPKIIDGSKVRPGQIVIALRERSFRSNGISSVRKALAMKFGERWWEHEAARPYIAQAAAPSVIYDRLLTRANGWGRNGVDFSMDPLIPVAAIAHITGGGIPEKFGADILAPAQCSSELVDLWPVPPIMRSCWEWRGMSVKEGFETHNAGSGVLVVLEQSHEADFFRLAKEEGIEAKTCGKILETTPGKPPTLTIHSSLQPELLTWTL